MKKSLLLLGLLSMGLTFVSCGDDNKGNGTAQTNDEKIIAEIDAEDTVEYTSARAKAWGNYMRVVGNLLVKDATTLYNDWAVSFNGGASYGSQFKGLKLKGLTTSLACVEQVLDGMSDIANEVGEAKIGDPYKLYTTKYPDKKSMRAGLYAVESWYSWHSRLDYSNNILSIRNAYYGVYDKNIGSMSKTPAANSMYKVVEAKNPGLHTQVVAAIDAAIKAIQDIPQPFRNHINSAESVKAQTVCATLQSLLSKELKTFFSEKANTEAELAPVVAQVVDAVILPTYKDLLDLNTKLYERVVAFERNPSNAAFAACCEAWIAARQPWESSEAFLFGPVSDKGLDPNMDTWPLDQDGIMNVLKSQKWADLEWTGEFNEDDASIGASQALRGFHTLEFLIFKNGKARTIR